MKVLIVSKTHMSHAACVGGLTADTNQNIRLLQPGGWNQPTDTDYEVGDVWELDFTPRQDLQPPHVEDVIVNGRKYIGKAKDIKQSLLKRVHIWRGSPSSLYDGLLRYTASGSGYIASATGIPRQSVGFWIADRPLYQREDSSGKVRYHLGGHDLKISYVGYAPPVDILLAGTLLRVSLARWWKPSDSMVEERCYLQLSGWYL